MLADGQFTAPERTKEDRARHRLQVVFDTIGDEAVLGPVAREGPVHQGEQQEGHARLHRHEGLFWGGGSVGRLMCVFGGGGGGLEFEEGLCWSVDWCVGVVVG